MLFYINEDLGGQNIRHYLQRKENIWQKMHPSKNYYSPLHLCWLVSYENFFAMFEEDIGGKV